MCSSAPPLAGCRARCLQVLRFEASCQPHLLGASGGKAALSFLSCPMCWDAIARLGPAKHTQGRRLLPPYLPCSVWIQRRLLQAAPFPAQVACRGRGRGGRRPHAAALAGCAASPRRHALLRMWPPALPALLVAVHASYTHCPPPALTPPDTPSPPAPPRTHAHTRSLLPASLHPPPPPGAVSADVSRAFDGVDIPLLLGLVEPLLRHEQYLVLKYWEVGTADADW